MKIVKRSFEENLKKVLPALIGGILSRRLPPKNNP
jgi:hypothetical protein